MVALSKMSTQHTFIYVSNAWWRSITSVLTERGSATGSNSLLQKTEVGGIDQLDCFQMLIATSAKVDKDSERIIKDSERITILDTKADI